MTKNREPEFTVTDKRRFTSEGDASTGQPTQPEEPAQERTPPKQEAPTAAGTEPAVPSPPPPQTAAQAPEADEGEEAAEYPAPTEEERSAQEAAFTASTQKLDKDMESALGGRSAQDFQMSFERFIASLYMSSLMQLGLMREQSGPAPQVDLMGARQTIDTLSILQEKTKGNLTAQEDTLLQNCLYELRMAYVEVTNAIARGPQPGGAGGLGSLR